VAVSTPFLLLLTMARTVPLADSFAVFLAGAFFTALAPVGNYLGPRLRNNLGPDTP
jgi:hypothetical protein